MTILVITVSWGHVIESFILNITCDWNLGNKNKHWQSTTNHNGYIDRNVLKYYMNIHGYSANQYLRIYLRCECKMSSEEYFRFYFLPVSYRKYLQTFSITPCIQSYSVIAYNIQVSKIDCLSIFQTVWCIEFFSIKESPAAVTRSQFRKRFWVHTWNIVNILFIVIFILMIWSGHNFAHVMTAMLSWHVQNWDLIGSLSDTKNVFISQDLDLKLINHLWNGFQVDPRWPVMHGSPHLPEAHVTKNVQISDALTFYFINQIYFLDLIPWKLVHNMSAVESCHLQTLIMTM